MAKKKYILAVGEEELWDILRQGVPHEVLFEESEWECNHKGFESLKGAVLISAFHGSTHWKLFFRTPEGKVLRVILPAEYFGRPFEVREHICDQCTWTAYGECERLGLYKGYDYKTNTCSQFHPKV